MSVNVDDVMKAEEKCFWRFAAAHVFTRTLVVLFLTWSVYLLNDEGRDGKAKKRSMKVRFWIGYLPQYICGVIPFIVSIFLPYKESSPDQQEGIATLIFILWAVGNLADFLMPIENFVLLRTPEKLARAQHILSTIGLVESQEQEAKRMGWVILDPSKTNRVHSRDELEGERHGWERGNSKKKITSTGNSNAEGKGVQDQY